MGWRKGDPGLIDPDPAQALVWAETELAVHTHGHTDHQLRPLVA
ncbi:hypothetical protein ACFU98_46095 [Streptomyces sp. NPDC057575]